MFFELLLQYTEETYRRRLSLPLMDVLVGGVQVPLQDSQEET